MGDSVGGVGCSAGEQLSTRGAQDGYACALRVCATTRRAATAVGPCVL